MMYRYNCPGVRPGKFVSEVDSPNAGEIISHAQVIVGMGGQVDMNQLMTLAGLRQPQANSDVGSNLQPMTPVAATTQPDGIPMAGGGPQEVQQGQAVDQPQSVPVQAGQTNQGQSPAAGSLLDV
jgi:hypothetical protein